MPGPDFEGRLSAGADAALAAFLDLDDLLRRAAAYASHSAGTEATRILLHDGEAHELVVAAAVGPSDDMIRGSRFPETTGIPGEVFMSGEARVAPGTAARTLMAAPLNGGGGRTIGVVETVSRAGGAAFTSGDLERFVSCCGLIAVAVESASLYRRVGRDTEILRRTRDLTAPPFIAESAAMRHALDQADRAAGGRSTILLTGETGTGKEHVARRIHERSARASGPFVAINCAALPEGLLESELFGHEKGAFTGADGRRIGWFELADGGTLLLDEIGDLPLPAQGKLLRVLQEREITRVGGSQAIRVNVRSDRGDAPEPRRRSARRAFSRGPVLSSPRRPHRPAASARTAGGHRTADRCVPRALRRGPGTRNAAAHAGGARLSCARIAGRATFGSSRISPSVCWYSAAGNPSARRN